MIVPSIDLMNGNAVQLVGGRTKALDAGDPRPLAKQFGRVGEIAAIDLDAALEQGSNEAVMRELLRLAPCRVGGGIRTLAHATQWLDWGAEKIILGTAAQPDLLRQLPMERVIAAVDALHGEVVVDGWRRHTGRTVIECMRELSPFVSGFLVTFVEREGRMQGVDLAEIECLVKAAEGTRLTIAGGITTPEEIAAIDQLGADAQVGMALYTGRIGLAEAFTAPLTSDRPDGLWPTVISDELGTALGLTYSNLESVRESLRSGQGAYHSRRRGLWKKGQVSGNTQQLVRIAIDCDRDALRFTVRQLGAGFCHRGTAGCWGQSRGFDALEERIAARIAAPPSGSYTAKLMGDPGLLRAKLVEEAYELAAAATSNEVIHEATDLLFFTLVKMAQAGVRLADVADELDHRSLRISRRLGNARLRKGAQ